MRPPFVVIVLLLAPRLWGQDDEEPLFTEMTNQVHLDFVHEPGAEGGFFMPESMGSGGALFDFDNDGDLDIFLVQAGFHSPSGSEGKFANRLYQQETDGTFTDITAQAGLEDTGYAVGVAIGDLDNDGHLDIFVSQYGPDVIYRNDGQGRFRNVTPQSGISGDAWSASALFCDYDADGFLDLYVTHYVSYNPKRRCERDDGSLDYCAPKVFRGTADALYHNEGDGTFTDVTVLAGIQRVTAPGLGVACFDYNEDGRVDFYVANDGAANQLWENQGNGKFVDRAFLYGVALNGFGMAEAGMGVAIGDIDVDGDFDLFVTHLSAETNTLYRNEKAGRFQDVSAMAGLAASSLSRTGFGTGFLDYDHDGDLDMAVVNGRVMRQPVTAGADVSSYWNPYAEPNLLLRNNGRGKFEDPGASCGSFCSQIEVSRGLALGDVDNDGDLDMLVTATGGPARLFKNDAEKRGHWLLIRAFDPSLERDAYGSVITVVAGGKRYMRIADPGYSYISSNDPRAHFGFPAGVEVERILVRWPDGQEEAFPAVEVDRAIVLKKGEGRRVDE